MKLTLNNIENQVIKAVAKLELSVNIEVTFDCGNAYITFNKSNHGITSVVFDDNGDFSTIYTTRYKKEILDDDYDYTGEFEDCDEELYEGNSLETALKHLRRAA